MLTSFVLMPECITRVLFLVGRYKNEWVDGILYLVGSSKVGGREMGNIHKNTATSTFLLLLLWH